MQRDGLDSNGHSMVGSGPAHLHCGATDYIYKGEDFNAFIS